MMYHVSDKLSLLCDTRPRLLVANVTNVIMNKNSNIHIKRIK